MAYSVLCPATKKAPMMNVRVNHSFIPHRVNWRCPPERRGCSLSAAKTPIWQVNELATRTMVFTSAKGKLSLAVSSAHISPEVERSVKYMAKRPAKNINSLESHTTVPTETILGRFSVGCAGVLGAWVADVT